MRDGVVSLPSLRIFDLNLVGSKILAEMQGATFKELGQEHSKFLDSLELDKYLTPKLHVLACDNFGYAGDVGDLYHVARKVEAGNRKERYRAHFDSHLFTLVLPIKIPESETRGSAGELIYFTSARKRPKTELGNLVSKVLFKRYASEKGIEALSLVKKKQVNDFRDYCPLIFIGDTTLHTNYPVSGSCLNPRLTLLAHFFDPSPKYGIGAILRRIRKR